MGRQWMLYKACKQWVKDEAKCFSDGIPTLAEVWARATERSRGGLIFKKYVVDNYEKALRYGEV